MCASFMFANRMCDLLCGPGFWLELFIISENQMRALLLSKLNKGDAATSVDGGHLFQWMGVLD